MHFKEYKKILSSSNGMNIYRGCSHGCIYCDSRSKCYQMDHDFEDIEVKKDAPHMLENELKSKRKLCMIGTGAMSDPYLHIEKKLCYTRKCLEVIDSMNFGVAVQTKSNLILRDLDLYKSINEKSKAVIQMTLTTYDEDLCRIVEPNVCTTKERFNTLMTFKENNIPTVVWLTPLLPFINDTEENLRGILDYCVKASVKGIISFGMGLTLREGDREYFYKKLDEHFPLLKEKYIKKYGYDYALRSDNYDNLRKIFVSTCKKNNIMYNENQIFEYLNTYEDKLQREQLSFF